MLKFQPFKRAFATLLCMVFTLSPMSAGWAPITAVWANTGIPSLKDAYKYDFLIGNILDTNISISSNSGGSPLLDTGTANTYIREHYIYHYNAVTAENNMKPSIMGPTSATGAYRFTGANTLVNWARSNGIHAVGHTLAWHSQSPAWLVGAAGPNGATQNRALAEQRLETYIKGATEQFAGRLVSWDVINEVFTNGGGSGAWKSHVRSSTSGIDSGNINWHRAYENSTDYIYDAFKWARKYDAAAKLYYNDFNEEGANKRTNIAHMINELNARWAADTVNNPQGSDAYSFVDVNGSTAAIRTTQNTENNDTVMAYMAAGGRLLIEGMGMQSHYNSRDYNLNNVRAAIALFISTGVSVSITELDITIQGTTQTTLPNETQLKTQADNYANLFLLYKEYANSIDRVSFWARNDQSSWRSNGGATGSQNGSTGGYPVLFENTGTNTVPIFTPKPAYYGVIDPYTQLGRTPPEALTPDDASIRESMVVLKNSFYSLALGHVNIAEARAAVQARADAIAAPFGVTVEIVEDTLLKSPMSGGKDSYIFKIKVGKGTGTELTSPMLAANVADADLTPVLNISIDNRLEITPVSYEANSPGFKLTAKAAVSGNVTVASYDSNGRLASVDTKPFTLAAGENVTLQPMVPILEGGTYKFFVWDAEYIPLTDITSVDGLL